MFRTKTSHTLLLAGITSLALTGCGGSSSSGGSSTDSNPLDTYTDLTWSAGSDEMVGLTYPQGAENGSLFALKRSEDSSGALSHTLLQADTANNELKAINDIELTQDYYRDVLALPVSGTFDGEELDTALVATCGYSEASLLEGGDGPSSNIDGLVTADTSTPAAQLEIYIPGTDNSETLALTDVDDNTLSLVNCHSMGGLEVYDLANKGGTGYIVSFYIHGQSNQEAFSTFNVAFRYDDSQNEIDTAEAEVYEEAEVNWASSAVDILENSAGDEFYMVSVNVEGSTGIYDFDDAEVLVDMDGNPFTSATDSGADILDLANNGTDVFAVSADAGLAGVDFGDESLVMLTGGDYENCVDALAIDGSTAWCHDSTDEGKLIEFTLPSVPQTEVVLLRSTATGVALRAEVSKEEAEQIKAELEGAGAEVEVK
jgi:hypothetical protein